MKKILSPVLLAVALTLLLGSCGGDDECFTPPSEFALDVRGEDGKSILPPYGAQDILLYYLDENNEIINVDFRKEGVIISLPYTFDSWLNGETKTVSLAVPTHTKTNRL